MRNQSTGGNKKAGPSSVDKAGGKKSMPKPRGKKVVRGATKPTPPTPPNAPSKTPKSAGPTPTPAPVPTPSFDLAGPPRTYTPAQKAAMKEAGMNNDKRYSNRLGRAGLGLGSANVGSRTGGIGGSRTVGIGNKPKPGAKR
jgi:hypothetical protein